MNLSAVYVHWQRGNQFSPMESYRHINHMSGVDQHIGIAGHHTHAHTPQNQNLSGIFVDFFFFKSHFALFGHLFSVLLVF